MLLESLDTLIAFSVVMLLLSLLITAIVQSVAALFGLRGKNLLWGLKRLLPQLDSALGGEAEKLAKRILLHPALTDRDNRLATALRAEELVLVLKDLSSDPKLSDEAKKAFERLFQKTVGRDSAELTAKAQELLERFDKSFPEQAGALRETVEATLGSSQEMVIKVNAWFETVMDRTSERFKGRTRHITIGVAAAVALVLGVDSLRILNQLRNNSGLRDRLVQMSEGTLRQAETVFAQTREEVAGDTIRALAAKTEPREGEAVFATLCPGVGAEGAAPAGDARLAVNDAAAAGGGEGQNRCAQGLATREQGIEWIDERLDGEARNQAVDAFTAAFAEKARDRLGRLGDSITEINARLDQTDVQLYSLSWPNGWGLVGRLMTVLFLSLGAPFWYNMLRKMSDLRPIVARKVEGEAPKAVR